MLVSLESFQVVSGAMVYFDTSAVFDLAILDAARLGGSLRPSERIRAERVDAFTSRIVRGGMRAVTTILSTEEIAAKVRNRERGLFLKQHGHQSWHDFKRANPTDAKNSDDVAHQRMLRMMSVVASATSNRHIEQHWIACDSSQTQIIAKSIRRSHKDLLSRFPAIDSMDALHIVIGRSIGATCFATLDAGWDTVADIAVCS